MKGAIRSPLSKKSKSHSHGHGHGHDYYAHGTHGGNSRYFVTRIITLAEKQKEVLKELNNEEVKKWKMKYSLEYDAFYYKHVIIKTVTWEDPRPALLKADEYDAFAIHRDSLQASLKADAFLKVGTADLMVSTGGHLVGTDGTPELLKTVVDVNAGVGAGAVGHVGKDFLLDSLSTNSSVSNVVEEVEVESVWKVKYSKEYGCNYFKNSINGEIAWEHPNGTTLV